MRVRVLTLGSTWQASTQGSVVNTEVFLSYNVAWSWFALPNDPWPADVQQRSYFTQRVAGPGTDYAPPGPDVPAHDGTRLTPIRTGALSFPLTSEELRVSPPLGPRSLRSRQGRRP